MDKIKVLHFFGKMDRGGAETFVMNVYRNIDREKFQFDFIVSSSEKGDYDDEIQLLGGNIYSITTPGKILDMKNYYRKIRTLIINNKYDVIHSHIHFFSGNITSIAKKAGVKNIISHSHSTNDGRKNNLLRNLYRRYMRYLIMKNSTYLFGCSRDASIHLYGTIKDKRIIQINNGVDICRFRQLNKKKNEVLSEIDIPFDSFIIGHIGRFDKVKNHSFLIDVFYEILRRKDNSYLVLVGKGDLQDDIMKKAKDLKIEDNIRFLGLREDIPELLNCFDLYLFPSLYEGLSVVLVEAQTIGIPCFVSDTITKENNLGVGNLKFISLDEDKYYWADEIINSKYERNCEAYKKVIEGGYSIEDTVHKIEKIYRS